MRTPIKILLASVAAAVIFSFTTLGPLWHGVDRLETTLAGRDVGLLAPRFLGLLGLLPFLFLVQGSTLVDMSRLQRALSLGLRALLLCGICLALARPSLAGFEQRLCTIYLVDVSDSISDDQLDAARAIADRAWRSRGTNEMHLITFARDPHVATPEPQTTSLPRFARHSGAGEETDIQAAMQHAYGIFSPQMLPQLVLLTDGNETRGDVLAESHHAAERGIRVFVQRLPERKQKEILVRDIVLPAEVRMGAPFDLSVEIYATHRDRATLTLYKDEFINALDGRKSVELRPGRNVVTFKSVVQESGTVSYRFVLSGAKEDTWKSNNTASALLPVLGRPKILYLEGEPLSAGYLKRALEAEKLDVVVRGPQGLPSTLAELQKFDLVLISDVPALYIGLQQMAALKSYVQDLGGGFIMAGGQNSFGAGGYFGTAIEKLLPVRFDTEKKRDQPSLALVLCLDRSGSMTGPKLELAKDAAKATTELIGGSDLIGVVAFDSSPYAIVRLQRAANRLRILNDISRIQAGGGTSIKPALQEAFNQLQGATAKVKHVILLSDGQSSYTGISQLLDEMVGEKITVSAVGVGEGADRTLLQMIAERGNGRFYHTDDATNIPKIFTKETTQVARSALVEERIKVRLLKRASVLGGIDWESAPELRGYVSTKPKPLSETLLVSGYGEPILALWRVGLGKTAAFTSDVKNRWAIEWLSWPGYRQFWAQLCREIMRQRVQQSFAMKAQMQGEKVHVTVDAIDRSDRFINGLESTLAVLDPGRGKSKQTFSLHQVAAGRYEGSFRLQRYGSFILRATHTLEGKIIAESVSSLSVPYPKEYIDLVQDQERLLQVAQINGRSNPDPRVLWDPDGRRVRHERELWPHLIFGLFALFLLDVVLRRVRLFGYGPYGRPGS